MKIKTVKFILFAAFLFFFAYINRDKIPRPKELKTLEFIITGGVDINLNAENKNESFSISYIGSGDSAGEAAKSNEHKNIFNAKSNSMNRTVQKLRSLTNKNINDSRLSYILIGENTAKENLDYFIEYYCQTENIRLNVNAFITKGMSGENFTEKILTAQIDVNSRLDGFVNDKSRLSSMTKKNLKDMMQIFYSKNKTGLIPVLSVKESPMKESGGGEDKKYTFEFYGLGIIKDGKLTEYLPCSLVESYLVLTKSLKTADIEITDENNNFYVYTVKNSKNKTSFEFDEKNKLKKVIYNINIETELSEAPPGKKSFSGEEADKLNKLQSDKIKSGIDDIIEISKKTNADFLNVGETLSIRHPYKWHNIKDGWQDIFKDIDYEINVSVRGRRK